MVSPSYKRFLLIWGGQLVSALGGGITAFAMGIYVYETTRSATWFSLVIASLFVPSILLRPLGGALADRFDRRLLILLGDVGSAVGVGFLLGSSVLGILAPWRVCLGVAVSSAFGALQAPAYKATVSDLVPTEDYGRAAGMAQLASSVQHLLAPVVAGFLIATVGLVPVLLFDLASFVPAVVTVLMVRRALTRMATPPESANGDGGKPPSTPLGGSALREGWKVITANTELFRVVLLVSLVTLYVGLLQTLYAPLVLSFSNSRALGASQSIAATGMLLGSIFLGAGPRRAESRSRARMMLFTGVVVAGAALSLMGFFRRIEAITAAFFFFFCALPFVNTGADVLVRTAVSNDKQGRAWGLIGFLSQIGYVVAYFSGGVLADSVFEPLLATDGSLAGSVGKVLGTGAGRGIGLLLLVSGVALALSAHLLPRIKTSKSASNAFQGV